MSNGNVDYELLAVRLGAVMQQALGDCLCNLCRRPLLVEHAIPDRAHRFDFFTSIKQKDATFFQQDIFQVPQGMIGVITKLALPEPYPGINFGPTVSLVINDVAIDEYAFVTHGIAFIDEPEQVWIPLKESDIVSLILYCQWVINNITEDGSFTYTGSNLQIQFTYRARIAGYFIEKDTPCLI